MEVISTISQFRAARAQLTKPLGFVPTMGSLHAGHMALIKRAREENGVVAVSIFVNAMQFNDSEDLERYPRALEQDLEMLREANVDLVFTPEHQEMYPEGFSTTIHVMGMTERLEGAHRMGHFDGVATVVCKLFNIVRPDRAYFGQKDAQQLVVVRHMVKDLDLPLEIVGVPTVRERDGLALSSRNVFLDSNSRLQALSISQALNTVRVSWESGERDADVLRATALTILGASEGIETEYVSFADPETLEELSGKVKRGLLSVAVWVGEVRLIDNVLLDQNYKM